MSKYAHNFECQHYYFPSGICCSDHACTTFLSRPVFLLCNVAARQIFCPNFRPKSKQLKDIFVLWTCNWGCAQEFIVMTIVDGKTKWEQGTTVIKTVPASSISFILASGHQQFSSITRNSVSSFHISAFPLSNRNVLYEKRTNLYVSDQQGWIQPRLQQGRMHVFHWVVQWEALLSTLPCTLQRTLLSQHYHY